MNSIPVDHVDFIVPIWTLLPILLLIGLGVWKLVKLLVLALRG